MARLEDFSRSTHPLVNDLKGPADDLGPTVRDLGDLAPDLERLFRDLEPLIRASRDRRAGARDARCARPSRSPRRCTRSSRSSTRSSSYFNFHQQTIAGFITNGGADIAADYGTGQRGQTQIGIIDGRSFEAYKYGDDAARLGARERVPASRTRSTARSMLGGIESFELPARRAKYPEDATQAGPVARATSWRPCFEAAAVALRRPQLPVPAQRARRRCARRRAASPGRRRPPTPTRTTENRDNLGHAVPVRQGVQAAREALLPAVRGLRVRLGDRRLPGDGRPVRALQGPARARVLGRSRRSPRCACCSRSASCSGAAPGGSGRSSTGWSGEPARRSRPGARRSRSRAS